MEAWPQLSQPRRCLLPTRLPCPLPQGLQLTKEQLGATADGGSLRAALVSENTAQILLVNDPVSKEIAQRWMGALLARSAARSKL